MNGNMEYENSIIRKIDKHINDNPHITCLRGYVNKLALRQSYSTQYMYINVVVNFFKFCNKKAEDLCYDDYVGYIIGLQRKGRSSSYQITSYAALKKLSEYLYSTNICSRNYMETIEAPKYIETIETLEKREAGYLTKREMKAYIDNIRKNQAPTHRAEKRREDWIDRDLAIAMLLLTTGMRVSALCKLDIDSIDFENHLLRTVDKERKIEEHYLSEDMEDILQSWVEQRELLLRWYNKTSEALFISNRCTRLSQGSLHNLIKKYGVSIKGHNLSPHKLRATYGTQIYEATHDLYAVQRCMGHASPSTTERYIRGQKNKGRKDAADIISKIIN